MSGGIAGRGRPGPAGPAGPMGPTGPQGDPAFTLAIGSVSALPYGEQPEVRNVGTPQDQVWDLALVTGATGVLTGPAPPTGADGTSLGQLYYCTANQAYYALIELDENGNRWRPIMTQENAIRKYELDVISYSVDKSIDSAVVGSIAVMLDDVNQKVTADAHVTASSPIIPTASWAKWLRFTVDSHAHRMLRADCMQRGVTSIPVTVQFVVNGVTTTETWDLLLEGASYGTSTEIYHLADYYGITSGSGVSPGVRPVWKEGRATYVTCERGAPGATAFGDAPSLPSNADDIMLQFQWVYPDEEYVKYVVLSSLVEVPYDLS